VAPFCDICENNFSLADLRRFKTQIYADFQPTTYSRRWQQTTRKSQIQSPFSYLHSPIPHSLRLSAKVPFCDICENNFSLADLRRFSTYNLQPTMTTNNKKITNSDSIPPFSILCDYLRGSFLRYLREQFLSRWFTQIFNLQLTADGDNKQQDNYKFRVHSPTSISPFPHSLRLSAKVPFCDICENNFSLADLRRFKTLIYANFQSTIYSRRWQQTTRKS